VGARKAGARTRVRRSAGKFGAVSFLCRCPAAAVSAAALDGIEDAPDVAGHLLDAGIGFPDLASVLVDLVVVACDDLCQVSDDACHDPDFTPEIVNARSNLGELRSHLRELSGGRIHVGAKYPRETFQRQLAISVCHLVLHQFGFCAPSAQEPSAAFPAFLDESSR
jgi:hypothetical protein